MPKELQTMVHVAYKVDDLDEQVKANTVVVEPGLPMKIPALLLL